MAFEGLQSKINDILQTVYVYKAGLSSFCSYGCSRHYYSRCQRSMRRERKGKEEEGEGESAARKSISLNLG